MAHVKKHLNPTMRDVRKSALIESLIKLQKLSPEEAHIDADRLLLRFINDERVTKAFDAIDKWYS